MKENFPWLFPPQPTDTIEDIEFVIETLRAAVQTNNICDKKLCPGRRCPTCPRRSEAEMKEHQKRLT